jgi:peptide/nickel transport system substrate-binding protein
MRSSHRRIGVAGAICLLAACSSTSASKAVNPATAAPTVAPVATTAAPAPVTAAQAATTTQATAGAATTGAPATTGPATIAPTTTAAVLKYTGGDINVGLDGEPATLDPAANILSLPNASVYTAVFETLMTVPVGGEAQPLLLKTLTEAPDRLSWTLVVQDGVKFHDGTPFDAAAVKFNLSRQQASPYNGSVLKLVTAIDVVDPKTLKVSLKQPWTAFPTVLTTIVGIIASPASLADATKAGRNPVGTGPFQFVEWVSGDHVKVKKFDGYWGPQGALVDSITYKIVPDETARYTALKAGDLDAMTTIVRSAAIQARADGYAVIAPPENGYGPLLMNTSKAPFNDIRVRQALTIGWDRDAVAKAFDGDDTAHAGFGPYPQSSQWYVAPTVVPAYNPTKAKELLAAYGKPVKFKVIVTSGNQTITDSLKSIAQYWNEIGVSATVEQIPDLTTYITTVITGNYEMAGWIFGTSIEPDLTFFDYFHTGGANNWEKFSDPALDTLLDQGRVSTDEAERMKLYGQVQQILRTDAPVIFPSHGQLNIVVGKRVTMDPYYFFPARTVHLTGS